jgi:hypothetical protein
MQNVKNNNVVFAKDKSVNHMIFKLLKSVTDTLVNQYSELGELSVFIGGSVARGEISYNIVSDEITIYSDFDFTIVVDSKKVKLDINQTLAETMNLVNNQNYGVKILSYVDCGVSLMGDIKDSSTKLFYYDFINSAIMLFSNNTHHDLTMESTSTVDSLEAIILLNNRILEQLIAVKTMMQKKKIDAIESAKIRYVCNRTYNDIGKAILIGHECYSIDASVRISRIEDLVNSRLLNDILAEGIITGTKFKQSGLASFESDFADQIIEVGSLKSKVRQTSKALLYSWMLLSKMLPILHRSDNIDINFVSTFRIGSVSQNIKAWIVFFLKQNSGKGQKQLLQPRYLIKTIHKYPPIWASYLSSMVLLKMYLNSQSNLGSISSLFGEKALPDTKEIFMSHCNKSIDLWKKLALGEMHE